MAEKATIRVKWVRSGIGFTKHQKEMIRNLGLHRLNEVVESTDTPSVRGLVTKLAHFVEIVGETPPPAWARVPEYRISLPSAAVQKEETGSSEPQALASPVANEAVPDRSDTTTPQAEAVTETPNPKAVEDSRGDTEGVE